MSLITAFFSKYFKYVLLATLLYFPIFGHLGSLPIRIWDESRLAFNAYEMFTDHSYLVMQYKGEPDLWNTKPPLMIWTQVISLKLFGVSEFALRFPSAMAALLTCILLLVFSVKWYRGFWFGFIASVVLVSSFGYIDHHSSRTGDFDTLLALFTTASGLCLFVYLEVKRLRYLYFFFLFLTLGVLTKGISGLLFGPGLLLYCLYKRSVVDLLKNKHFYVGLAGFIGLVGAYYLLREWAAPGYLEAVQENELGGRFMEVIENHKHGFFFYYDNILDFRLKAWYLFIPAGIALGMTDPDSRTRNLTFFSSLLVITFFLVISSAQTKLQWYDVPLFPFLALLISIFVFKVFEYLTTDAFWKHTYGMNMAPFIFLFLIAVSPYKEVADKTYKPKEYSWDADYYELGYFLKDALNGKEDVDGFVFSYHGYAADKDFYITVMKDAGKDVSFKTMENLAVGDHVLVHDKSIGAFIEGKFAFDKIDRKRNVTEYHLKELISPSQ